MKPNECIFLSGYKKYFKNDGYGWTATYGGPDTHQYKYDEKKQAVEYITAIDAVPFGRYNETEQFRKAGIDRELLKAYCGFSFYKPDVRRVVTGNWGCGAFGGNLRLKFLIQWLACSAVGKDMVYCPYGHRSIIYEPNLIKKISSLKVGEAYTLLQQACSKLTT
jgi:poly(ADP-ribose) glycohydrolase